MGRVTFDDSGDWWQPPLSCCQKRLKIIFTIQLLSVFRIGKSKLHIFGPAGMQKSLY